MSHPGARVAMKEEVRRLLARRMTQAEIGEQLGVSQQAISAWKRKIEADAQAAAADRAAEIATTLETLTELEREAWAAWERSKQPGVTEVSESGHSPKGSTSKGRTTTEHQVGDASYLSQVQQALQQRRALLGLDAPIRTDMQLHANVKGYVGVSPDDWDQDDQQQPRT